MTDLIDKYDPADHEPMPEGEEEAPPLTHTMAIVRWILLGAMTLFALSMILSSFGATPWASDSGGDTQYHCPMHPTYISSQPGDCPICGMSLVPIDKKPPAEKIATPEQDSGKAGSRGQEFTAKPGQYYCPMHQEVVSDSAGKCPKCGMFLEKYEPDMKYTCPMHPQIASDQPGECPECGMDLVPMEAKMDAGSLSKSEHQDEKGGGRSGESIAEPGQYYCPMDPDVAADSAGKCPECGMFLEEFEPGMKFTCKVHPALVTDKPGDCPACGMDLTPVKTIRGRSHEEHGSDLGPAPVPGLVPVSIQPQRLQLIGVRSGPVESRVLSDETRLVGYITPDESRVSNLNIRTSGWVQKLFVDRTGQDVTAGQRLLTVYSQDLYQAQQDFLVALQADRRQSSDSLLTGVRRQILDAARDRLALLGVPDAGIERLEATEEAMAELLLESPFDGVILEKSVFPGKFVGPDQTLYTIADLSRVWVLADVYESDLASVRIGQKAVMTLAAFPGQRFQGTVSFIYPTFSQETRTLKVRLEFKNPEMKLRPGMYVDVRVSDAQGGVLTIPRDAVMDGGDIDYAFVIHDRTHFEPRSITTGRGSDDFVEVLSGLNEGEIVVTSANFLIDSESRLQAAISGMGGLTADTHAGHGK